MAAKASRIAGGLVAAVMTFSDSTHTQAQELVPDFVECVPQNEFQDRLNGYKPIPILSPKSATEEPLKIAVYRRGSSYIFAKDFEDNETCLVTARELSYRDFSIANR